MDRAKGPITRTKNDPLTKGNRQRVTAKGTATVIIRLPTTGNKRANAAPLQERPRIYLASSLQTFSTPRYDHMVRAAERHFPDATIVPTRGLYADSRDWRARWHREAHGYSAGVVFADASGCIGRGTYTEIQVLQVLSRPVYFLDDAGTFRDFDNVRVALIAGGADWHRYARLQVAAQPAPSPDLLHFPNRLPKKRRNRAPQPQQHAIQEGGV